MSDLPHLLTLGGIFLLACCSPGPVFLLIATTSAERGRAAGVRTGLGVACATFLWASCTALGLGAILASLVWAQGALRLIAGIWLIWLGIGMIRRSLGQAAMPAVALTTRGASPGRAGFITSITNPKALAFFGSAFALTAPPAPGAEWHIGAVLMLTMLSALWHVMLALVFAAPGLQRGYRAAKRGIDLSTGAVLAALGGAMLAQFLRRPG